MLLPMQQPLSPSVRRRRLSKELRRLRETAGYTAAQAAKALGWAQAKVTKQELNKTKTVSQGDLEALLDLYQVQDASLRETLGGLARDAQQRGWWTKYQDVFPGLLPDFEAEASVIYAFESQSVPGLLQTPEYAYEMFRGTQLLDDATIQRRVESRMERQTILNRHRPPTLHAVIDEAALRRQVGSGEIMREQVQYLANTAVRHNINIHVLPFQAGAHAGSAAPFTLLDFPNPFDSAIVYIDTVTEGIFVEDSEDIARYRVVYSSLQSSAMSPVETADFLADLSS